MKRAPGHRVTYRSSGVDYRTIDVWKRRAQKAAAALSAPDLNPVVSSRGESAFVWKEPGCYRALVIEGLGTKNLVADEMHRLTGKHYYRGIARDTVAMIVNDLATVGAVPQVIHAYFAIGSSGWFSNRKRASDLVRGWADACRDCGAVWGGGETPVLADIVSPDTIDLAGCAVGVVRPRNRLLAGSRLRHGDTVIFVASNGIHANGLTMARRVAGKLPQGLATVMDNGKRFGDMLLTPTLLYVPLIRRLQKAGAPVHYAVNITGHGWRKIMRADAPFTYVIDREAASPDIFRYIQTTASCSDREMYATFNMGAGFALYVPANQSAHVIRTAQSSGYTAWAAGHVERGVRSVHIPLKHITFRADELEIR